MQKSASPSLRTCPTPMPDDFWLSSSTRRSSPPWSKGSTLLAHAANLRLPRLLSSKGSVSAAALPFHPHPWSFRPDPRRQRGRRVSLPLQSRLRRLRPPPPASGLGRLLRSPRASVPLPPE